MKRLLFLPLLFVGMVTLNAAPEPTSPAPAKAAPFRLVVKAYDGIPRKDGVDKFFFQIDTIDLRQPSAFLKLGEVIPGTLLRLTQFTFKEALNQKNGEQKDISEITVVNIKTRKSGVLVFGKATDVSALNPTETPPAK